jgi:hypothetical protein
MRIHEQRRMIAVVAALTLVAWAGCQKTETANTQGGTTGDQANGAQGGQVQIVANTPDGAVIEFLNAVRTGDEATAGALLTDKARTAMEAANMYVQPPGSPNANFAIGQVQMKPEHGGAHVGSTWTDVTPQGETKSYEITWILRQENNGWRVAGMATQLVEDMERLVLNFEDPADMRAQVERAEAELARRAQGETGIRQATNPTGPTTGALR